MARKAKTNNIRVSASTVGKVLTQRLLKVFFLVLGSVFIIYILFAATILRVVPTTTGAGFVPVKNITFQGGSIPKSTDVLVKRSAPAGKEILDRLKQSFTPMNDAAVVKILDGPYGKLSWSQPGIISVNGEPSEVLMPENSDGSSPLDNRPKFLEDEYLVMCISGACLEGTAFISPAEAVVGSLISSDSININNNKN